jgi:hypothetical protein
LDAFGVRDAKAQAGSTCGRRSVDREAKREQNGEDMSFFVKNVENVQVNSPTTPYPT